MERDPDLNTNVRRDQDQEADFPPYGVSRGARTTLDAIRPTDTEHAGMMAFTASINLSGVGVRHFQEQTYSLGSSSVLLHCERTGKDKHANQGPKAVRVWICLKDAEKRRVRQELLTCESMCEYDACGSGNRTRAAAC